VSARTLIAGGKGCCQQESVSTGREDWNNPRSRGRPTPGWPIFEVCHCPAISKLKHQRLMGYSVLVHAAVQFRAGVGIDLANSCKILSLRPRRKRVDIQLGAIDKLEKIGRSFR